TRAPDAAAPSFPAALRFPLAMTLEWRAFTLLAPGLPGLFADSVSWRSAGSQAMRGEFRPDPRRLPGVRAEAEVRWRGPGVRYRVTASAEDSFSFLLSGIREKRDLRLGFDSVEVFMESPEHWLPSGILGGPP